MGARSRNACVYFAILWLTLFFNGAMPVLCARLVPAPCGALAGGADIHVRELLVELLAE